MLVNLLVVFICLHRILGGLFSDDSDKYIKCNLHVLDNTCPENSACIEFSNGTTECKCTLNYKYNSLHRNSSDYCVYALVTAEDNSIRHGGGSAYLSASSVFHPKNNRSAAVVTDLINHKESSAITSENQTPNNNTPHHPHHHIAGGILIPLFLVFIILGSVYAVKRMNLMRRMRELSVRRRNRQGVYEDVMMSNDNDDPPLI